MRHGFSLIELMIVVAITLILATLALMHSSWISRMLIKSEIEMLAATCQHLARTAQLTQNDQELTFDISTHSYSFNGQTHALPNSLLFGAPAGVKGPPSAPSHLITSPITFPHNHIVMSPSGIIQAGTVYLTDSQKNKLYALSAPVSQVSFLRIYRYDGKWHLVE